MKGTVLHLDTVSSNLFVIYVTLARHYNNNVYLRLNFFLFNNMIQLLILFVVQSMYALMAKCEELSKNMKPIYHLADQMYPLQLLTL